MFSSLAKLLHICSDMIGALLRPLFYFFADMLLSPLKTAKETL